MGVLGSEHRQQWEELTSACHEATIFHTYEWEKLLRLGVGHEIPLYWGVWIDGKLVGMWPTSVVPAFAGKVLFSLPHSNSGVPVTKEGFDGTLSDVVARVTAFVKREGVIHWSVDVKEDSEHFASMPLLGFKATPVEMTHFDLDTSLDPTVLWQRLAHSARRAVRKAKRCGVEVWESTERGELLEYQTIHESTMKRLHRKGLSCEFFDLLYSLLVCSGKAKLFLCRKGNRVLAGNLVLLHNQKAYGWSAASRQDSLSMCPNGLLLWSAIEWASRSGIRAFDLGPSPRRAGSGLNLFKRQFGATQTNLTRFTLSTSSSRNLLATTVVGTYRRMGKRGLVPKNLVNWLQERMWFD